MAVDDEFVIVRRSLFDYLRQHCEHCPDFNELQDLSVACVVSGYPSGEPSSKKRKILHRSEPQELSQSEPQQPSQRSRESGSQLLSESSNTSRSKNPKSVGAKGPRKNEAVDWFLRNAPKATEWRKRQTELELNTVEQYEEVIRAFTDRTNVIAKREPHQRDGHSENQLVDLAERFALLTKKSLTNAILQKSFARFQALILLSYCEVLRKRGILYDTVDRIIQHITDRGCDRRRLLESVLWINGVIIDLVSHGWTIYRATELFFIDALSLFYLTRFQNDENSRSILEHFKTDEFVKHDYSDCLRPEYTISGLIASLLDPCSATANKLSIGEICASLGYATDCVPKSVESIYKVHAVSKSTAVAPVDLDFEVLMPSSFQSNDGPLTSASNSYLTIGASDPRRFCSQESGYRSMNVSPETSIPPLLYAMGGRIPKFMLERAVSQPRWNSFGVIYDNTPQNADLHAHLRDLLSDGRKLQQAIERLVSLSVISMQESDGMETYICGWESAQFSYVQNRSYWIHQAFVLFCYAFSHRQTEYSLPGPEEKSLLAILEHILREYSETGLEMPYGNDVVETLLAASRFGALGKRQHLVSMAAKLMRDPGNILLQAKIVHRQSVLLRLKGDICGSKRQIQEFLNRSSHKLDLRSHSVLGLLYLTQAANHAYDFNFCQAHKEAQKWKPPSNHTQRHMDIVWDQICFAGRTLKGQGSFNEAKQCFESCLATDRLCESKRILIKSNLADLYGELDYLQRKECNSNNSFLNNAEELVKPEIERLKACGEYSKGFRRLLLALIEVEIRRCRFDNADILINEILGIYSRLTEPDIIDRLGHVRALIARARISPLCEAEGRWSDALDWNRKYNPFEEEVFTCGLVYLFICSIRFQLGNWDGSRAAFNHAMEVINGKMPQFLIPGVGTYLFDSVQLQIKSVAGWVL